MLIEKKRVLRPHFATSVVLALLLIASLSHNDMSGVLPKWFTSPHAPQSPAPQSHFERRSAIRSDIDDIFEVVQAGFPDDPEVNYRFPNRSQYPDQYADWTKTEYIGYLNQPKKFEIQVIEALDRYGSRSVVALAVWDKAVLTPAADIGTFAEW